MTGIFEASVTTSLGLIEAGTGSGQSFGIVSTGKIWEEALDVAVKELLGLRDGVESRFKGCETTGLNASELHELPVEQVRGKMIEATRRLIKRDIDGLRAVCLGCAGMVGLEEAVRTACVQELGDDVGKTVYIIDGVKAGVGMLVGMVRGGF